MAATLDLTRPYDNMVARELLRLANKRNGCGFTVLKHTPVRAKGVKGKLKPRTIVLKRDETSEVRIYCANMKIPEFTALGALVGHSTLS